VCADLIYYGLDSQGTAICWRYLISTTSIRFKVELGHWIQFGLVE
jgi:hypothetical protein